MESESAGFLHAQSVPIELRLLLRQKVDCGLEVLGLVASGRDWPKISVNLGLGIHLFAGSLHPLPCCAVSELELLPELFLGLEWQLS